MRHFSDNSCTYRWQPNSEIEPVSEDDDDKDDNEVVVKPVQPIIIQQEDGVSIGRCKWTILDYRRRLILLLLWRTPLHVAFNHLWTTRRIFLPWLWLCSQRCRRCCCSTRNQVIPGSITIKKESCLHQHLETVDINHGSYNNGWIFSHCSHHSDKTMKCPTHL